MTQYKVSDLSGALLDAAVAECGEWKTAHEHFPTMTLDSTFSGWFIYEHNGERYCMLKPNNPMRQDPQHYEPSIDWRLGGPIIEREVIVSQFGYGFWFTAKSSLDDAIWCDMTPYHIKHDAKGNTLLESAMRTYVMSKFGETVELHD